MSLGLIQKVSVTKCETIGAICSYIICCVMGERDLPLFFMYFVIWKPKDKFTSFSNTLFAYENEAKEFAKKSIKRKIEWDVVPYNKENYEKYWFK